MSVWSPKSFDHSDIEMLQSAKGLTSSPVEPCRGWRPHAERSCPCIMIAYADARMGDCCSIHLHIMRLKSTAIEAPAIVHSHFDRLVAGDDFDKIGPCLSPTFYRAIATKKKI